MQRTLKHSYPLRRRMRRPYRSNRSREPLTPDSGSPIPPPLTPIEENTNDSPMDQSPDCSPPMTSHQEPPDSTISADSARNSTSTDCKPNPTDTPTTQIAMTYLVSLWHALPFLYRIGPPPSNTKGNDPQHPGPLELEEIAQELGMMNLEQRLRVPHPSNPLIIGNYRTSFCAMFAQSPQLTPYIGMVLTLISMIYPSQYGWNQPAESCTSPTILMSLTPASESISNTEICYYEQFRDGIILQKGDDYHVYHDKSYIPTRNQKSLGSLVNYPFGWTTAIEEFCQSTGHHPNCANPISRSFIE